MPNQCITCGTIYEDTSDEILKGCGKCQGKFFFFVKKDALEKMKALTINLTKDERQEIEGDILELTGLDKVDQPVILDIESIRILKPGQYELDLIDLFRGKPVIYKLEEGKYLIDLATTFKAKELED